MGDPSKKDAAENPGKPRAAEYGQWWEAPSLQWAGFLRRREEQVFLVLTLLIGALVGATVVAFIVLTEHFGARIHPTGDAASATQNSAAPTESRATTAPLSLSTRNNSPAPNAAL